MSDNLFGELDIESANDNPFFKPDGTYTCLVTEAGVKTSKNGHKGLTLTYSIQNGPKKGSRITEWLNIPMPYQLKGYESESESGSPDEKIAENAQRSLSFLKKRLKEFEIPADKMNSLKAEDLLNLGWVDVTIKNTNNGRESVTGVKLAGGSGDDADPFA